MLSNQSQHSDSLSTFKLSVHPLITEYRMQYGLGEEVRESLIKFVDSVALNRLGETLRGYEGYLYSDAEHVTLLLEAENEVPYSILDQTGTHSHFLAWVKGKKTGNVSSVPDLNVAGPAMRDRELTSSDDRQPQLIAEQVSENSTGETKKARKVESSDLLSGHILLRETAKSTSRTASTGKKLPGSSESQPGKQEFNSKERQREIAVSLRGEPNIISLDNVAEHIAVQALLLERILKEDKSKMPLREILGLRMNQIEPDSSSDGLSLAFEAGEKSILINDKTIVNRLRGAVAGIRKAPQQFSHLSHLADDSAPFFSLIGDLSFVTRERLPRRTVFEKICDQQKPLLQELIRAGVSIFDLSERRIQHLLVRKSAVYLMRPEDSHRSPIRIPDGAAKDAVGSILKSHEKIRTGPREERPLFCGPNGKPLIPDAMSVASMLNELVSPVVAA